MADRQRRVTGEGSVYQRASDGRWVGVVDLGWVGGKRVRKTVTAQTLKDLRPKFRALKDQAERGVVSDNGTVAAWLDYWMSDVAPKRVRPRTLQGYRGYVETWLKPQLGRRKLSALRPEHIRAMHRAMEEAGRSDATRRQAHMILQRALKDAVIEQRLSSNPAERMERPPVGKGRHDYHTADEARAVLRSVAETEDATLVARVMLAYLAGLRQGEVLGLHWEDVDLDLGEAHVRQALTRIRGEGLVLGPVKSEASDRFVPLVEPLTLALVELRKVTGSSGWVFGGPVDPRKDWQIWKDALSAAGVKSIPLHGARASCASLLRRMGASERLVADVLGHAQVSTTQAHYIRTDDRQRREALEQASKELLG